MPIRLPNYDLFKIKRGQTVAFNSVFLIVPTKWPENFIFEFK